MDPDAGLWSNSDAVTRAVRGQQSPSVLQLQGSPSIWAVVEVGLAGAGASCQYPEC